MPVFFNGAEIVSPATASDINDSALANTNVSGSNVLAIIGNSAGGQPNTALAFTNPTEAAATLISGDLADAVRFAFAPSSAVGSPSKIVAIRANPATQATATLTAAGTPVIALSSADYGVWTNNIAVKVEQGSVNGKLLTVQSGSNTYTADNVSRSALTMGYNGQQASATVSTTATTVALSAPAGTVVATIDLTQAKTVQDLAQRINSVQGFFAIVTAGSANTSALNGLDTVTAQDVMTRPFNLPANLQAVIDWLNNAAGGLLVATRQTLGVVPDNAPFVYLTGGSDDVTTASSYQAAYNTLQSVDVQWVVPLSTDPAVAAMNDAHCQFMSTVGRLERRSIVGMPVGTTDAQAIALAQSLNSDRTSLTHLGPYMYNSAGVLTLYSSAFMAAMIGGMFCGASPGTPMTNKVITIYGIERQLRNPTDTDPLLLGGVMPVEFTSTGYKIVQSISTWLTNQNYNRREQSCGVALDFTARAVRTAVDVFRGQKGTPQLLGQVVQTTETVLRQLAVPEPVGPGVLVGDSNSPAYSGIQATLEGDVVKVQFQCSPVIPANYVLLSIFATPYSGTATVTAQASPAAVA